jgi:hypothetical protein
MLISEIISELDRVQKTMGDIPVYLQEDNFHAHFESTEIEVGSSPIDESPVVTIL